MVNLEEIEGNENSSSASNFASHVFGEGESVLPNFDEELGLHHDPPDACKSWKSLSTGPQLMSFQSVQRILTDLLLIFLVMMKTTVLKSFSRTIRSVLDRVHLG